MSRYVAVPVASILLIAVTASGSFRRWERAMYVLIGLSAIVVPLAVLAHAAHPVAASALLPGAPLGLITTGVQALAGVLLPSATVFLLLLCNDQHVLGPWVNPRWLNVLAACVVGVLVSLSTILTITTIVPHGDVAALAIAVLGVLALVLASTALVYTWRACASTGVATTAWERHTWTTPPLETLPPPSRSRPRQLALIVLRGQLTLAAALLVVRLAQLGLGE